MQEKCINNVQFHEIAVPDDDTEIDEEIQAILNADFEIGHYIRERIIHRAVLYFTGKYIIYR